MECRKSKCTKSIDPNESCPHCKASYCSEECRISHWIESHQFECADYINFKLEDLSEVNESNLKLLGKGSYGEVKLYKHNTTSVLYAIKIIDKEFIKQHSSINILLREITIHKNLKHPNVIQLIKHFEDSEKVFIVLEYANKGSLFRIIRKEKGLEEVKAWKYFSETCLGMKYLHDNGIIHRDLKPENILVDEYDNVKICDFGWCVQSNEIRNTFCGTLEYMAPEMILCEGHSFQVDLWALGILLYELLHGYAPFRSPKDTEMRKQILSNDIKFDPKISSLAKDLILKIVKGDPNDRINLDQILAHPWIEKFVKNYEVKVGGKIRHPKYEIGQIVEIAGLVCKVKFTDTIEILALPDVFHIAIVENATKGAAISLMETDVFNKLDKWCTTKSRGRKKIHSTEDHKNNIKKEEIKKNTESDHFSEESNEKKYQISKENKENNEIIVKQHSNQADFIKEEDNTEENDIQEDNKKENIIEEENKGENAKEEVVLNQENAKENALPNEFNQKNPYKKGLYNERNYNSGRLINPAEGLFENEKEYSKVFELMRKNSKKLQNSCRGLIKIPNFRDMYTKDSTQFQKTFNIKHKIDISQEAFESKKKELISIRQTIDDSNFHHKKPESGVSFWSSLFGCIDR